MCRVLESRVFPHLFLRTSTLTNTPGSLNAKNHIEMDISVLQIYPILGSFVEAEGMFFLLGPVSETRS